VPPPIIGRRIPGLALIASAFVWLSKRRAPSTIGSKARSLSSNSIITKGDVMPVVDAAIVAAIVAAFVIFAGVLARAEQQTRDLPPRSR
jgi:hypothetical protein